MSVPASLPTGWYHPSDRVPRQGQDVRVWTHRGVDRVARFSVSHTDRWPSGASWVIDQGRESLAFEDVEAWSPDLHTPFPASQPAVPEPAVPEPTPEPVAQPEPPSQPAVLREVVVEVGQTGDVLRLLPSASLDWSPHPSIPSLRTLSLRLVRLVARIEWILDLDSVEMAFEPDLPNFADPDEIIATFKANAESVEGLIGTLTPDDLRAPWTLERNGQVVTQVPRGDALRQFGLTPLVYHRGEAALLMKALGAFVPDPCPLWSFSKGLAWTPAS